MTDTLQKLTQNSHGSFSSFLPQAHSVNGLFVQSVLFFNTPRIICLLWLLGRGVIEIIQKFSLVEMCLKGHKTLGQG